MPDSHGQPTFLDPDADNDVDLDDPILAPGIWFRMGYADAISGRLDKKDAGIYQPFYDNGFNDGKWQQEFNPPQE